MFVVWRDINLMFPPQSYDAFANSAVTARRIFSFNCWADHIHDDTNPVELIDTAGAFDGSRVLPIAVIMHSYSILI